MKTWVHCHTWAFLFQHRWSLREASRHELESPCRPSVWLGTACTLPTCLPISAVRALLLSEPCGSLERCSPPLSYLWAQPAPVHPRSCLFQEAFLCPLKLSSLGSPVLGFAPCPCALPLWQHVLGLSSHMHSPCVSTTACSLRVGVCVMCACACASQTLTVG